MSEEHERIRREHRDATDRFITLLGAGLQQLDRLAGEISHARDVDAEVRSVLPPGETGDTIREWLDGHDRIADELQALSERLSELLESAAGHAAATEIYLHELSPGSDDPRDHG